MKNNTVVIACNANYYWGAFLLTASMRMNGMDEPVLVYQPDFPEKMKESLEKLGGIRFIDAPKSNRNMTCRKGEAMLCADTEYISWIDCDGIFTGNCSSMICSPDPDAIQVRIRGKEDNFRAFNNAGLYEPDDEHGAIPRRVLEVWQKDVGERKEPRISTCGAACALSVHRQHRDFLERWQNQMDKVLPGADSGVVNNASRAYYQLDESVLNSLLAFMEGAPQPAEFQLDKNPAACYVHFILYPKPWQWWSASTLRHYASIMKIIDWAKTNHLLDYPLPFALKKQYCFLHHHLTLGCWYFKFRRKWNQWKAKHRKK